MKQENKTLLLIIFIPILLAILYVSGLFNLNVIGEEGYNSYDALLDAGAIDHNLWNWTKNCGTVIPPVGSSDRVIYDACMGVQPYSNLNAQAGALTQSAINPFIISSGRSQTITTKNLRLVNAKFTLKLSAISATPAYQSFSPLTGASLSSSNGLIDKPTFEFRPGDITLSKTAFYELTWDDYSIGHYQIKKEGIIIQEGTIPEGTPFTLSTIVTSSHSGDLRFYTTAKWSEFRTKDLFDCDLQDGEVRVVQTWDDKGIYDIGDLRGWKRFCPSQPAYHDIGGLSSNSNQIFYALAQGESVSLIENEFWEIPYIADRVRFGLNDSVCEYYNIDAKTCTGSIHVCDNFVPGVGCTTLNENLIDIIKPDSKIEGTTLYWSSYGKRIGSSYSEMQTELNTGGARILKAGAIIMTCTRHDYWEFYPANQQQDCLKIPVVVGSRSQDYYLDGDMMDYDSSLIVKLDSLDVKYTRDAGENKDYWTANWKLDFASDSMKVESVDGESVIDLASQKKYTIRVKNNLPFQAKALLVTSTVHGGVNVITTQQKDLLLNSGETKEVTMEQPAGYLGESTTSVYAVLQTIVGGVAFTPADYVYDVTSPSIECTTGQKYTEQCYDGSTIEVRICEDGVWELTSQSCDIPTTEQPAGFFQQIIQWFKDLFSKIFSI